MTVKHLEAKVSVLNGTRGYEEVDYSTVGSVRLYRAYGATGVHQVMNESGGVNSLMELGTMKEAAQFLSGLIAGIRIARGDRA